MRTTPWTARVFALAAGLGCAGTLPRPAGLPPEAAARADSLATSVEAIASSWTNLGRQRAVERRAAELGLGERTRSEWIDWWSLQKNVVIEIPGRSRELVYVVAHYDKVDMSPLTVASLLANGVLDPLLSPLTTSAGAVDNGTGVAVALELGAQIRRQDNHFTYRVLLVGSEEAGLRGSRAHVARMPRSEKDSLALAIVIDTTGLRSELNCVYDVSDEEYATRADEAAARLNLPFAHAAMPSAASSDYAPFARNGFWRDFGRGLQFNLIGGLLPQRSWFTGSHSAPVVFFSSCNVLDWGDWLGGLVLLPLGRLHGPRDRLARIDAVRLWEQYAIALELIRDLEARQREPLAP